MVGILALFSILWVMMLLANKAEQDRLADKGSTFTLLTYLAVGTMQLLLIVGGFAAQAAGAMFNSPDSAELITNSGFDPEFLSSIDFNLIGLGLWVPALFGLLVLLPPVRRAVAKVMPKIDPDSIVHAVALSFAWLILPNLLVTLGVGLETLADNLAETTDATDLLLTTWGQNLGLFVLGLIGVGWLTRRSLKQTLRRLDLRLISIKEVGIGIAAGIALLIVLAALLAITEAVGLDNPQVDALSEELYGPFFQSIFGILTVGLAAAWGEETIFRGALQPKFGRLFTSFLFAIVHGNYGISMTTLGIFIVGYALGVIKDRYSTTTAMVTHATFNCVQALLAFLALQYGIGI